MSNEYLEFIVAGANIAGHMEQAERIDCGTDSALTDFLTEEYENYNNAILEPYGVSNWFEYIEDKLLKKFAF